MACGSDKCKCTNCVNEDCKCNGSKECICKPEDLSCCCGK